LTWVTKSIRLGDYKLHKDQRMSITIENFTPRQKVFADIFWEYQTLEEIHQFIHILPTNDLRIEAMSAYHMLLAESFDQENVDLSQTHKFLADVSRNSKR
jgi:hypothetical protein